MSDTVVEFISVRLETGEEGSVAHAVRIATTGDTNGTVVKESTGVSKSQLSAIQGALNQLELES